VCSLEPQEGEDIVASFLRDHPAFRIDHPAGGVVTPTAEGWLRILPGLLESDSGLDGFFMARLVRSA
jgi:16S rRNA (cytosine967-C5)-methyltransferase